MKKLIALAAFVIAALPAGAQQAKYTVKGTDGKNGKTVYVVDLLKKARIDSVSVANGQFSITGTADRNALLAIQERGDVWQTVFFNDGTPITINMKNHMLEGSAINRRTNRYALECKIITEMVNKMGTDFGHLTEEQKDEQRNEFIGQAEALYNNLRDLCKYILEKNSDNLIPAAFITQVYQLGGDIDFQKAYDSKYVYARHPYAVAVKRQIEEMAQPEEEADDDE